jgi:hypothetical protein
MKLGDHEKNFMQYYVGRGYVTTFFFSFVDEASSWVSAVLI